MEAIIAATAHLGQGCLVDSGSIVEEGVFLGDGVQVGANSIIFTGTTVGNGSIIQANCLIGLNPASEVPPAVIGPGAVIRAGTIIYAGVVAGRDLQTGHFVLVRERSRLGDEVLLGSSTVVDGDAQVGDRVKAQTGVYITRFTVVESDVFLGPYARTTNDRYMEYGGEVELKGPTVKQGARIGCGAILLPGVVVGTGAVVGAGSVVVKDVDAKSRVVGVPARVLAR